MNRGFFLKTLLSLVGTSLVVPFDSVFLSKNESDFVSRETTLFFPPGKSFSDFQRELDLWMNKANWLAFVDSAKKSGQLISMSKKVTSQAVTYSYVFNSQLSCDNFERLARQNCAVNLHARESLGYSEKNVALSRLV